MQCVHLSFEIALVIHMLCLANRALDKILTLDYIDMAAAYDPADMATKMGTGEGISMYVLLDPEAKVSSEKAAADIAEVTEGIPANIAVSNSGADMSAMMGSGVQILVKGDDMDKLMATAEEIGKLVEGIEGFEDIDNGLGDPAKELRVTVDKNKAMKYGLTVSQIYSMLNADISTSTDSITVTTDDGDYPIVIKADPDKVLTREKLADHKFTVNVPDSSGATKEKTVYLTDIADVTETTGPAAISHTDQTRYIQVSAMAADGYNLGLLSRELEDRLDEYTAPAGVSVELSGENENIKDMLSDTILMILLACAFIYLIMVAQFQSLLLPFIIIFTIPLAFSGGLLCLMLCGQEISIVAMLGFLLLAGIIVNNGIVFIDRVNQLVAEGYQRQEALVTAGRQRMRPILMTALTTICSLLAMVFSQQMGAEMLRPMAIVAAAGMVYATVLTLFLVPALYDIFKGKSEKRKARREAARAAKEQAMIPEKAEI